MRAGARIFFCFVAFRSGLMPATRATLSDTDMSPGAEIFLIGIPSVTGNPAAFFPPRARWQKLLPRQITHGSKSDGGSEQGQGIEA